MNLFRAFLVTVFFSSLTFKLFEWSLTIFFFFYQPRSFRTCPCDNVGNLCDGSACMSRFPSHLCSPHHWSRGSRSSEFYSPNPFHRLIEASPEHRRIVRLLVRSPRLRRMRAHTRSSHRHTGVSTAAGSRHSHELIAALAGEVRRMHQEYLVVI